MIYMQMLDFYSSDIEKVLKIEFNYGSMMRTFKNMNYDNEVLICHGDDIVLSNGAYSGVNKPFKTLEAIGKISDSVYRSSLCMAVILIYMCLRHAVIYGACLCTMHRSLFF